MLTTRFLISVPCLLLSAAGWAADIPAELAACAAIDDDRDRLACYDAAVSAGSPDVPEPAATTAAATVAATAEPTAAATAAATAEPTAAGTAEPVADSSASIESVSQEELFGLTVDEVQRTYEQATGKEELKELAAVVTDVQKAGHGDLVVWLDNGQVWRQTNTPTLKLKVGDAIVVRKAAFGSFKMKKASANTTMRVSRIQ